MQIWGIQWDLGKNWAVWANSRFLCKFLRFCVYVNMYTLWWTLQLLWFGQLKLRTFRGSNAAQSDCLTIFIHHECVNSGKKKSKLHFGFAIKVPPLKLSTVFCFLSEGLEPVTETNCSSQSQGALCSCRGFGGGRFECPHMFFIHLIQTGWL